MLPENALVTALNLEKCRRLVIILLPVPAGGLKMDKHADLIMVSYNSRPFLPKFFDGVKNKTAYPLHLIVIDNNSSDGSRAYLKKMKQSDSIGKRMKLILNPKNLGVAKAWNMGINVCKGEYILFLNPDLKLTSGWLEKLISCAERHPKAGVVGAKILNFDGTIYHAGFVNGVVRGKGKKNAPDRYGTEVAVHGIQGCCFLVKRSIIPKVGKFDERFFIYAEEDDYCLRVRKAGYKVMYAPVPIYHHREGSAVPPEKRRRLRLASKAKFHEKWGKKK